MNTVNAIGRLTKDPELIETSGGTKITTMRLAIDRERRDGAVFVDVKCFGNQAAACDQYLHKGSQIGVTARLELDEWKDSETDESRSKLYLVATSVKFLDAPSDEAAAEAAEEPAAEAA